MLADSNQTFEEVRSCDVFRLGVILMQLINFEKTHQIHKVPSPEEIEMLFRTVYIMDDETVRKVIG